MTSFPKWLLVAGFGAGYIVLCFGGLISSAETFGMEEFLASVVAYAVMIGGTLLIPWVLVPVITSQPSRRARLVTALWASLLPVTVAIGGVACLFLGWDASQTIQLAICLSIAAWFIPALGALIYAATQTGDHVAQDSKKTNSLVVTLACILAPLVVGVFAVPFLAVAGWVTRTESPDAQQTAEAREFLHISPKLKIKPLAYYEKDGMDYMLRFKFIARTQDPSQIFDRSHVDPSAFATHFNFPSGEATHNEAWWDVSSRPISGGHVRVAGGRTLTIGYAENEDETITVYAWRHEGAFELFDRDPAENNAASADDDTT